MAKNLERLMFERSQDAVVLYKPVDDGADFVFVDVNPACERLEGVRADDLIGRRVTEAFPSIRDFGLLEVFRRVWNTGEPETFNMSLYTDDRVAGYRENHVVKLDVDGLVAAIYHDTTDLRGLLDSVFGYMGIYTLDGRLIEVNTAPLEAAGLSRTDVIGMPFWETPWWSHSLTEQGKLRNALARAAKGETVRDEFSALLVGEEPSTIDAVFGPLPDVDGHVARLFGFAVDISEKKAVVEALEQSEERYRRAQAIANIGSWELDLSKNTLWWSDEIFRLFEIEPERFGATYEAFLEAIHPEDRDAVSEAYDRSLNDRSPYDIEHRLQMADGRIKWVREHCETDFAEDGTPLISRGTVQDITELKGVEARAIAAQNEAEDANRAKSEFLAAMSHEIRTPLNAVIGFAEALELGIGADDPQRRGETLRIIAKAGKQVNDLIGDILDYSKIEADSIRYHFEQFYPGDVLEECMPIVDHLLNDTCIEFIWHEKSSRRISADKTRFNQILLNFISNAVKYNRKRGAVEFGCQETLDGGVRIFVRDTGEGVPEDIQGRLFSRFERAATHSIGFAGTGLGLSICKKLTEDMNGTIGFDTTLGTGSTFWVQFPAVDHLSAGLPGVPADASEALDL